MKITAIVNSPEPCQEAGWHARQWLLERPLDRSDIAALRPLGSLLLLDALEQPFFKVESHHCLLKGLLGDPSVRVACHRDHEDELQTVRDLIQRL